MKKVLVFSITYFPFVGGAEVALKEISSRVSDIQFDIITLRIDENLPRLEKVGNLTIHRVGFKSNIKSLSEPENFLLKLNKILFPIMAFLKAGHLHKENNYSFIWAIMANYAGLAALFFKLKHPNVPYLLTLQEGDPIASIKKKIRFIHPLFVKIFTKAQIVQPISNHLKDFAIDMGYEGHIEVIPNGVDMALFSKKYEEYELESLKKEFGKREVGEVDSGEPVTNKNTSDDVFLITTSRLVEKNRVEDIISSLFYLPQNVKLIVIGTGYKMLELKSSVSENDMDNRVFFLGFIDQSEIPKYMKICDIFVRPSLSEGFGNSFVEAMVAGLPVIATNVGGIKDFIFDPWINRAEKPTGLFCEIKNPQSIAEKVTVLMTDKNLKEEITHNAYEMVKEKYDWNLITERMNKDIFLKLCSQKEY